MSNQSNPVSQIVATENAIVQSIHTVTALVDQIGRGKVDAALEELSLACVMASNRLRARVAHAQGMVGAMLADITSLTGGIGDDILANLTPAPCAVAVLPATIVDTIPVAHPVESTDHSAIRSGSPTSERGEGEVTPESTGAPSGATEPVADPFDGALGSLPPAPAHTSRIPPHGWDGIDAGTDAHTDATPDTISEPASVGAPPDTHTGNGKAKPTTRRGRKGK